MPLTFGSLSPGTNALVCMSHHIRNLALQSCYDGDNAERSHWEEAAQEALLLQNFQGLSLPSLGATMWISEASNESSLQPSNQPIPNRGRQKATRLAQTEDLWAKQMLLFFKPASLFTEPPSTECVTRGAFPSVTLRLKLSPWAFIDQRDG